MKYFLKIITLLALNGVLYASAFSDVPVNDPNYNDFRYAVRNGYFSVYDNATFKPNTPITRREASIILSKITKQITSKTVAISETDLIELNKLANSYRSIYTENENTLLKVKENNQDLNANQESLQKEMTRLNYSMKKLKKERKLLFGLLAISTIAGILN